MVGGGGNTREVGNYHNSGGENEMGKFRKKNLSPRNKVTCLSRNNDIHSGNLLANACHFCSKQRRNLT